MGDTADMAAEDEILYGPFGTYDPGLALLHSNWDRANHPGFGDPANFTYDPGFGYGLPITAVRGGIQYPKSAEAQRRQSKEAHMPEPRMTKAQIEKELRVNAEIQEMLRQRRLELQQLERKAIPAEPHSYTMFTVAVRYKMRGKFYQFLILRNGPTYFTTGTKDAQKMFPSWAALCAWLEGPDVYSHSDIEILQSAGKVISFDSGAIENLPMQQPPF